MSAVTYTDEIPAWSVWTDKALCADLDGDAVSEADVVLHADQELSYVTVSIGADLLFTSPDTWQVFDVFAQDINHDGCDELIFLVWRRGSFGSLRPFWITENDTSWSQHVAVYHLAEGELRALWMSSAVGLSIVRAAFDENDVMTLTTLEGIDTRWQWGSWGFVYLGESEAEETTACDTQSVSLLIAGDNIIYQCIYEAAYDRSRRVFDFSAIYADVQDYISSFDIAAVTQETPLVHDASIRSSYPEFGTPESIADALVQAGFDVICSATNHVNDKGLAVLTNTINYWAENYPDICVPGIHGTQEDADTIKYLEVKGATFALFDYTYGLNGHNLDDETSFMVDTLDDSERLLTDVAEACKHADCVIVFLHIGEEYVSEPSDEQKELVEQLIDAGAALIACSHSHVVGPYGELTTQQGNTGLVFWGLGNFVAAQGKPQCQQGGLAQVFFEVAPAVDGKNEVKIVSFDLAMCECVIASDGSARVSLLEDA